MKRTGLIVIIIILMMGGYSCGPSGDRSDMESKVKGEVETLKEKVSEEEKALEEDFETLQTEKDYEKALKEEPKAPAETMEQAAGGAIEGEDFEPLD